MARAFLVISALFALIGVGPLQGQSIRGELVSAETGQPLTGTLVVLVDEAGARRASTLTGSDGIFLLRASVPGRYRLRAERVGIESTVSPLLDLAAGQTIEHRLIAGSAPVSLEGLVAVAKRQRRCVVSPQGGAATAQVWEEARKALDAARHTEREGLRFEVVRYQRELDPRTLLVRNERIGTTSGSTVNPFVSVSPESLQDSGYVRAQGNAFVYYAPDAAVLLSDPFLDGHCFRLVPGGRQAPALLGLAFEPIRGRRQPDVGGTLWLDAKTAAIQFLEFHYTGLEHIGMEFSGGATIGGRVEFERLPDGRWITPRWWIRMPLLAERVIVWGGSTRRTQHLAGLAEEGGRVRRVTTASGFPLRTATDSKLVGVVFDSTQTAPLSGARVFLEGTDHATTTDARGRFEITDAPSGTYGVRFSHPRLDSLGYTPPVVALDLTEGVPDTVALAVPSMLAIRASPCADSTSGSGTAVVVGRVVNRAADSPTAGAVVSISWGQGTDRRQIETVTDAAGHYVVCSVPQGETVSAVASFLDVRGSPVEFSLAGPGPFERDLSVRWYSRVAQTSAGHSLGASRQPVRLTGRVLDGATEQPVEGAVVRLPGAANERRTDRNGKFGFAEVRPGVHPLEVHSPGYVPLSQEIAVGGGALDLELRIRALAQTGRVVVRVSEEETTRPISGARLRFPGVGLEASSDAEGIATFPAVPPGQHELEFEHPERGHQTQTVRVGGGTTEIRLRVHLRKTELDPLVVTAESREVRETRARGVRRDLITREEIESEQAGKRHVGDLLRGKVPGLRIFEGTFPDESGMSGPAASRRLCIQMNRAVQQIAKRRQCSMIAVYLDGVRIADPGSYLLNFSLENIESVEVLGPIAAGARYGTESGYGVLEIYTRGNRPAGRKDP